MHHLILQIAPDIIGEIADGGKRREGRSDLWRATSKSIRVAASSAATLLSPAKDWGWLAAWAHTIPKAFGLEAATRKLTWDMKN
jgi:hypothetical protein